MTKKMVTQQKFRFQNVDYNCVNIVRKQTILLFTQHTTTISWMVLPSYGKQSNTTANCGKSIKGNQNNHFFLAKICFCFDRETLADRTLGPLINCFSSFQYLFKGLINKTNIILCLENFHPSRPPFNIICTSKTICLAETWSKKMRYFILVCWNNKHLYEY